MKIFFSRHAAVSVLLAFSSLEAATRSNAQGTDSIVTHAKLRDAVEDRTAVVENEFIVKLDSSSVSLRGADVQSTMESLVHRISPTAEIFYTYDRVFKGAAIRGLQGKQLAELLDSKIVEYATPNTKVKANVEQSYPVWNLDRIDQTGYPLTSSYNYNYTGKGVEVFVLDTGVLINHTEFKGKDRKSRATCSFNAIPYENCTDDNGHGTHVAGTIGGKLYGVAKEVNITAVKVLDTWGEGSTSGIIAGIDYVIRRKALYPKRPMVINMSLGGPRDDLMNEAVIAAVEAGIFTAVAAGNNADDSCKYSPASAPDVMTVGATQETTSAEQLKYSNTYYDFVASFSAVGKCVDIFAPGNSILSASPFTGYNCPTKGTCTQILSGTSMASPHVAAVAALWLSYNNALTPATITAYLKRDALKGNIAVSVSGSWTPHTTNLFLQAKIPLP